MGEVHAARVDLGAWHTRTCSVTCPVLAGGYPAGALGSTVTNEADRPGAPGVLGDDDDDAPTGLKAADEDTEPGSGRTIEMGPHLAPTVFMCGEVHLR
ncbi:hypothetical protein [Deinococcus pimensis]|uniref:hypothetical protein n=1 Tax=Deinococcus pimensis TaxID=309888 RepID=UPI0004871B16|nr:hypothetical protein [Deinococcus pimensis]